MSSWQTQREASRPYFTFRESPIVELSNQVSFEFKFRNVGTHPATELTNKTMIFNQIIYLKWPGVIDYKVQPLIHAETGEKQSILKYLKSYNLLSLK